MYWILVKRTFSMRVSLKDCLLKYINLLFFPDYYRVLCYIVTFRMAYLLIYVTDFYKLLVRKNISDHNKIMIAQRIVRWSNIYFSLKRLPLKLLMKNSILSSESWHNFISTPWGINKNKNNICAVAKHLILVLFYFILPHLILVVTIAAICFLWGELLLLHS